MRLLRNLWGAFLLLLAMIFVVAVTLELSDSIAARGQDPQLIQTVGILLAVVLALTSLGRLLSRPGKAAETKEAADAHKTSPLPLAGFFVLVIGLGQLMKKFRRS